MMGRSIQFARHSIGWPITSNCPKRSARNSCQVVDRRCSPIALLGRNRQRSHTRRTVEASSEALRENLGVELLAKLKDSSPVFFERLVVELLVRMGYGGTRKDAIDYAARIDSKIVLIDGEQLWNLMIDFGIGVSTTATYEVKRIDNDYFSEEGS
jgi:restriction endonuclease Mrr